MSKPTLQEQNIKLVQGLVAEYQKGNAEAYLAGCADDIRGSILGGLIEGGEDVKNKVEFIALMGKMTDKMTVSKFEPTNWRATGNDVLFSVDWTFLWHDTGVTHNTVGVVRKVIRDGKIAEKYHMCDVETITGGKTKAPHDQSTVTRVQELLGEIAKDNPAGYMEGVADDVKADMLGGLIPGAEKIQNKAEFQAIMGKMGDYMDMKKFAPRDFRALPNSDMMFLVDTEFVWKATGKLVQQTSVVRKVLCDNMITEKYHMAEVAAVGLQESPREVIEAAQC